MLSQAEIIANTKRLGDVCPIHGVPMLQLNILVKIAGEEQPRKPSPVCPKCAKEQRDKKEEEMAKESMKRNLYLRTYDVLMRDSTIPEELKSASFDNFIARTQEEKNLLDFVKRQTQKYLGGAGGNTLLTGTTGIGKTHLTIAMAKTLNETFKERGTPKSVLFVNLTEILRKVRESFKFESKEGYYSRLLMKVDYLILDDLGVKQSDSGRSKSAWEEEFIFDVLSHRKNTIISTNLSNDEIANLYSERVASHIRTGLEGNVFKALNIKDKRYTLNQLKQLEG